MTPSDELRQRPRAGESQLSLMSDPADAAAWSPALAPQRPDDIEPIHEVDEALASNFDRTMLSGPDARTPERPKRDSGGSTPGEATMGSS